MLLALDSAAVAITLYEEAATSQGPRPPLARFLRFVRLHSIHGTQLASKGQVESLTVANVDLGRATVTIAPRPGGSRGRREQGLVPTSLFDAVYFDNAAGVVVLNPAAARDLPPGQADVETLFFR